MTEYKFEFDPSFVHKLYIPSQELHAINNDNKHGMKLVFGLGLKAESPLNNIGPIIMLSMTTRCSAPFETRSITISTEKLKGILEACALSENNTDMVEMPEMKEYIRMLLNEMKTQYTNKHPLTIFFKDTEKYQWKEGLGVITDKNGVNVGTFETAELTYYKGSYEINTFNEIYAVGYEIKNLEDLIFTYYDLNQNLAISFTQQSEHGFTESFFDSIDSFDESHAQYKQILTAYNKRAEYKEVLEENFDPKDFFAEQRLNEFKETRYAVIQQAKESARKKVIASKFSDIDLI